MTTEKKRAPRNRTLVLSASDRSRLKPRLIDINGQYLGKPFENTVHGDFREVCKNVSKPFVDLLILDPPYNLNKVFNGLKFSKKKVSEYTDWLGGVIDILLPTLKPTATIYICGDWHTSISIFEVASKYFVVRNRITWEREKGRGAKSNWKNSSEDIWFCTMGNDYKFNVDAVKLRRKVIAPYTNPDGTPKDWNDTSKGKFRDTHPSNLWTDITIPFWSMLENTDHPTQKSEKLISRLVIASSNEEDVVFDPFLGSGTTSVVAKKLNRQYLGVEINEEYCLLAERRLEIADKESTIQGYYNGVFWERSTLSEQLRMTNKANSKIRSKSSDASLDRNQSILQF